MQTGEIILLASLTLVILGGLVSLGIGHRRWSLGTVVAGFLVLLAAATYLYLGARLAVRDRAWKDRIRKYQNDIARIRDDQAPDAKGTYNPPGGGPQSLERLREDRDRWRRGLDRVENWHGRVWRNASFQPPRDNAPGKVELAAEANAEDTPPIGGGSRVFLFDATPLEDGGSYIGEFLVESTSYVQESKRHVLTVVQTNPPDAYDTRVLARAHDSVTVFEDLPVDRWLAFYRSRRPSGGEPLPVAAKEDAATVRGQLGALVEQFVESFEQHEEDVPRDEWQAAEAEAAERPGTLWAEVAFTKPHTFQPAGAPPAAAGDGPQRDFKAGDRAEFDLQTAADLRDSDGAVTIERVFRRRPLTDALTLLHGSLAPAGDGIRTEGAPTLLRLLQEEIATLEKSNERLRVATKAATDNTAESRKVITELESDLKSWRRDANEAVGLADRFQAEFKRTEDALAAAEAAIVANGRELIAALDRLAREIDRVAPPPDRRAARP